MNSSTKTVEIVSSLVSIQFDSLFERLNYKRNQQENPTVLSNDNKPEGGKKEENPSNI
jgi:hypothetical protein